MSAIRVSPMPRAMKPKVLNAFSSRFGKASTNRSSISAIVPLAMSSSYSPGLSCLSSSSDTRPVKITGSIGNLSGRKWVLKKWMVKMNATASSASSEWMIVATLTAHPGMSRVKKTGNHRRSPVDPMMKTPQKTAK